MRCIRNIFHLKTEFFKKFLDSYYIVLYIYMYKKQSTKEKII